MKKHVLLINPWIHDFSAYDYWMKPLGLLYMASYLRENGMVVQFIDCLDPYGDSDTMDMSVKIPARKPGGHGKLPKQIIAKPEILHSIHKSFHRYGMTPDFFRSLLRKSPKPDLILVTAMMTYWYSGAFEVIKITKEQFPNTPIVLGGNYVTLCPEHAPKSGADFILAGAGESHIPFLVQDLLELPLLYQPEIHDLDSLPYPAFDLSIRPEQVPILTSRGCPFRCPYCASHLLSRRFERRDPLGVVDEINFWSKRFGIRNFSFYDDALLTNPEQLAIPMMADIISRRLNCQFHCPNGLHLREITPEVASLMFKAGFKTLRFGFETSDISRQKAMGGKADNRHLREAVACLRHAGYDTRGIGIYILYGLPDQTDEEVIDTIHFVQSTGAKPILAEFSPIPGTDLWRAAVHASSFPIDEEPLFHNNSLLPCLSGEVSFVRYHELKKLTRIV